jgi:hypothetical protein
LQAVVRGHRARPLVRGIAVELEELDAELRARELHQLLEIEVEVHEEEALEAPCPRLDATREQIARVPDPEAAEPDAGLRVEPQHASQPAGARDDVRRAGVRADPVAEPGALRGCDGSVGEDDDAQQRRGDRHPERTWSHSPR